MPPVNVQQDIFELGLALGYFSERDAQGTCNGVTMAWISACMLGDEKPFQQRIQRITHETDKWTLPERINQAKEQVKQHQPLSEEEINLLEILAFYEQILLFQQPEQHVALFQANYTQQNIIAISQIVASKAMAAQGGLCPIHANMGLYTANELATYLERIAQAINASNLPIDCKFSFMLRGYEHAQSLSYDPTQQSWSLMNINQWPPTDFSDPLQLAEKIIAGFTLTDTTPEYTAAHIQLISTRVNIEKNHEPLQQLVTQLNTIKNDSPITAETITRQGIIDLLLIAAREDDADTIKILGALNTNLNQTLDDGTTAAYIAAESGHVQVLKELGTLKANINQARDNGATPAYIAIQNGHTQAVKELGLQHADFNSGTHDGVSPLFIAAQFGHIKIVRYLVHYPGIQHIPLIIDAALFKAFARGLSVTIQQKIEEHVALKVSKGEEEANISVTPAEIAYILGHDEVVAIFKDFKPVVAPRLGLFKPALDSEKEPDLSIDEQKPALPI